MCIIITKFEIERGWSSYVLKIVTSAAVAVIGFAGFVKVRSIVTSSPSRNMLLYSSASFASEYANTSTRLKNINNNNNNNNKIPKG